MRPLKLHSPLAAPIQNFINLRRLSGTDYKSQAQLLGYFDRFLLKQEWEMPRITREIADGYQQSLSHLTPRTRSNRFCVVRQLCKYLVARSDPQGYVPETLKGPPSQGAHQPYIYSHSELQALLAAASELPPENSLRPHTYKTLLGILYSTGIRIGEALALNMEHFHSAEQRLHIAEGKFQKARLVPLSASTCRALQQYVHKRLKRMPRSTDSPLFLNERSRRLHQCTVNQTFRNLLKQCGIHHTKPIGPRIHDLRHYAEFRIMPSTLDRRSSNVLKTQCLVNLQVHFTRHSPDVIPRRPGP